MLKIVIMLISFTGFIFAENIILQQQNIIQDSSVNRLCYKFTKDDFIQSLANSKDIIIDITDKDEEPQLISLRLSDAYNVIGNKSQEFECFNEEKKNYYICHEILERKKVLKFFIEKKKLYLHIQSAYITSEPTKHSIKSKSEKYAEGVKSQCYQATKPKHEILNLTKGSKKEKLFNTIDINDTTILDIDYNGNLAIAVGYIEKGTTHYSVFLKSLDNGRHWKSFIDNRFIWHEKVLILDEKKIILTSLKIIDDENDKKVLLLSLNTGKSWEISPLSLKLEEKMFTIKNIDGKIIVTYEKNKYFSP